MRAPETRTSDYVCVDCGQQYLTREQRMDESRIFTFHRAECGLCDDEKPVTNIRHYNHLQNQKKNE